MQRAPHRVHTLAAPDGRRAWAGTLVLAFTLPSLVTPFGIGLAGFLFAATALAWRRDSWRLLRQDWPRTRWVLLAFLLQLLDVALLAMSRGHGVKDLDAPLRMCMAMAAMLVVQAAGPGARALWMGAAGGACAALAFIAWQRLALGLQRPGGLMNPITFGDLSLCLAWLALGGLIDRDGPPSRRSRWTAAGGVLCGLAASLLTGSRGGWLALLLMLALLPLWLPVPVLKWPLLVRGRQRRRLVLAAPLLAGALAAAAWGLPQTGVRDRVAVGVSDARLYLAGNPAATSLSVRLALWKAGAMLARERPWTGRDPPAYKRRMREWVAQGRLSPAVFAPPAPPHLHNDALQMLVTRGVTGLLAWAGTLLAPGCFFAAQLRRSAPAATRRTGRRTSRHTAALAGLAFVLAYAGFGLTEVIFWSMKASLFYALTVFLLMGYCLSGQEALAQAPAAGPALPDTAPAARGSHPPWPATGSARRRGAGAPRWRARVLRRSPGRRSWERAAGWRSGGRQRSGCGW
jgi:O-antigen ligase